MRRPGGRKQNGRLKSRAGPEELPFDETALPAVRSLELAEVDAGVLRAQETDAVLFTTDLRIVMTLSDKPDMLSNNGGFHAHSFCQNDQT
jgi:hypothetical protein